MDQKLGINRQKHKETNGKVQKMTKKNKQNGMKQTETDRKEQKLWMYLQEN